jgi:DNA topoisomerase-1
MKLLIVESPGKTKKLREILGDGWRVEASVGHIRDLPEKELGLTVDLRPQYVLTPRGREVAARLRKAVAASSTVYLATDPDREGESIAWHLQQVLKLSDPHRCTFNEINPDPVRAAVGNPRTIDTRLVAAQEARRVLDRLVGYNVSPTLSRQHNTKMSAGRVQSVAVRLVVERERAIEQFKPVLHYAVQASFAPGWSAIWQTKSLYPAEPHYCLDSSIAARVAQARDFTVRNAGDRERTLAPHPPFTTSTLQQAASAQFGFAPALTMELAQKLYEAGAITYHRTDSPNLSTAAFQALTAYAGQVGMPVEATQRIFKAKEDAQAAHEAIRPSHFEEQNNGSGEQQAALYRLIRLRALASQMPVARFAVREALLVTTIGHSEVVFQAKGESLIAPGWKTLYVEPEELSEGEDASNPVPDLEPGQKLKATDAKVVNKKTAAPRRFTQASLIAQLEAEGIGRPSTYAAIMDRIVKAGYVTIDKKQIVSPTALAGTLVDTLVGRMSFIDVGFTRELESQLDEIAAGRAQFGQVVGQANSALTTELRALQAQLAAKAPAYACPSCGQPLTHRMKPKKFDFWGCRAYPECKTSLPDQGGVPDFSKYAPKSA